MNVRLPKLNFTPVISETENSESKVASPSLETRIKSIIPQDSDISPVSVTSQNVPKLTEQKTTSITREKEPVQESQPVMYYDPFDSIKKNIEEKGGEVKFSLPTISVESVVKNTPFVPKPVVMPEPDTTPPASFVNLTDDDLSPEVVNEFQAKLSETISQNIEKATDEGYSWITTPPAIDLTQEPVITEDQREQGVKSISEIVAESFDKVFEREYGDADTGGQIFQEELSQSVSEQLSPIIQESPTFLEPIIPGITERIDTFIEENPIDIIPGKNIDPGTNFPAYSSNPQKGAYIINDPETGGMNYGANAEYINDAETASMGGVKILVLAGAAIAIASMLFSKKPGKGDVWLSKKKTPAKRPQKLKGVSVFTMD